MSGAYEKVAGFVAGAVWFAFAAKDQPADPSSLWEPGAMATVAVAGLAALAVSARQRHGLDNPRMLAAIAREAQKAVRAEVGWLEEREDLQMAAEALEEELHGCVLDKSALVEAAFDARGFPARATEQVLSSLAARRPAVFGSDAPHIGRRFAEVAILSALQAAVETPAYLKQLTPKLDLRAAQALGAIADSQTRIELRLAAQEGLALTLAEPLSDDDVAMGVRRFIYSTQWIPLQDRDEERARLQAFCEDGRAFGFAVITGEGGAGKSRLAHQACLDMARRGWQAGFLERGDAPGHGWGAWAPNHPTLIVVDYAGARIAETSRLLRGLATRPLARAVRVLLLERDGGFSTALTKPSSEATWPARLLREIGSASLPGVIRAFRYEEALDERPPDPGAIMRAVFARYDQPPPSLEAFEAELEVADPDRSPLFAVLVADEMARGREASSDDRFSFLVSLVERQGLLDGVSEDVAEVARNVLALATLVRGFRTQELFEVLERAKAAGLELRGFLAPRDDWRAVFDACARLLGHAQTHRLSGLEPDLIGEAFALWRADPDTDLLARQRGDTLRELAWAFQGEDLQTARAGEMLELAAQDFTERWVASALSLPPTTGSEGALKAWTSAYGWAARLTDDVNDALSMLDRIHAFGDPEQPHARQDARAHVIREVFNQWRMGPDSHIADSLYWHQLVRCAEREDAAPGVCEARADCASTMLRLSANSRSREGFQFYGSQLKGPAERPGAPPGVRAARAEAAGHLCLVMPKEPQEAFFRTELEAPARRAGEPNLVYSAWASAVKFKQRDALDRGLKAGLRFYFERVALLLPNVRRSPQARWQCVQVIRQVVSALGDANRMADALDLYKRDLCPVAHAGDPGDLAVEEWSSALHDVIFDMLRLQGPGPSLAFYHQEYGDLDLSWPWTTDGQKSRASAGLKILKALVKDGAAADAEAFFNREFVALAQQPDVKLELWDAYVIAARIVGAPADKLIPKPDVAYERTH